MVSIFSDSVAAIGARGLAMALNRIIDKDIDATNPRTENRHLVSGSMSMNTAWTRSIFPWDVTFRCLATQRNCIHDGLASSNCFVIYPYTKRYSAMPLLAGTLFEVLPQQPLGLP